MSLATNTIDRPATATIARSASTTRGTSWVSALRTLTARRFALSARTPREILVPLLTPVLFALVIAPALDSIGPSLPGVDYMTFAALGTAGLLVPLNCIFAGIGVMVDRESGARRDLLGRPDRQTVDRRRQPRGRGRDHGAAAGGADRRVGCPRRRPAHVSDGRRLVHRCRRAAGDRDVRRRRDRSPTASRRWRSSSVPPRRWRSCPGSSPARSSRSPRCPPG